MAQMAIAILWLLIGVIILAGVVWLAIWVIEKFIYPIPEKIKQGVWVIVLLLCLIALITVFVSGRAPFQFGRAFTGVTGPTVAALPAPTARHM